MTRDVVEATRREGREIPTSEEGSQTKVLDRKRHPEGTVTTGAPGTIRTRHSPQVAARRRMIMAAFGIVAALALVAIGLVAVLGRDGSDPGANAIGDGQSAGLQFPRELWATIDGGSLAGLVSGSMSGTPLSGSGQAIDGAHWAVVDAGSFGLVPGGSGSRVALDASEWAVVDAGSFGLVPGAAGAGADSACLGGPVGVGAERGWC